MRALADALDHLAAGAERLGIAPDGLEAMLRSAYDRWYMSDAEDLELLGVEHRFESPELGVHGIADLVARVVPEPRAQHLRPYAGEIVVVDWKSTSTHLDSRWKQRLYLSWQWRMYSAALGARLFLYRGISQYLDASGLCETREFGIEAPPWLCDAVRTFAHGVRSTIRHLIQELPQGPWPRAMTPQACHAYGSPCPFLEICERGDPGPPGVPEMELLTYSRATTYLLCPERMRLSRLEVIDEEALESSSTSQGRLLHEALAILYTGSTSGLQSGPERREIS